MHDPKVNDWWRRKSFQISITIMINVKANPQGNIILSSRPNFNVFDKSF